jgi:hypothetical protein
MASGDQVATILKIILMGVSVEKRFKVILLKQRRARKIQIYMKAS